MSEPHYSFDVTDETYTKRLDKFLATMVEDLSRERLKGLIEAGLVCVNDSPVKAASYKIAVGDTISFTPPPPTSLTIEPENIPLDVLYEDDHLIVINKPAGMSVHPSGPIVTGTLVNALLHHCKGSLSGIGGVERPGIVHRLDKGTSGVMVVAKEDKAHQRLSDMFKKRTMARYYLALTYGVPRPLHGEIEGAIGRHSANRKKMAVLDNGKGKEALTEYEVLNAKGQEAALVKLKLHTGRTHQIRVHLTHMGHPIMGDPVYGNPRHVSNPATKAAINAVDHQLLHATILGFKHPITKEELYFETPVPSDFQAVIDTLK